LLGGNCKNVAFSRAKTEKTVWQEFNPRHKVKVPVSGQMGGLLEGLFFVAL
jgi:hypothetical protein